LFRTSKQIAVRGNIIVSNSIPGSRRTMGQVGRRTPYEVTARTEEAMRTMVTADANAQGSFGSAGGFGTGSSGLLSLSAIGGYYNHIDTLLYGITPEDEKYLRRYYRDIYYYDTVLGSAVDLMSTLPFSDWTLTGLDEKKLDIYNTSIERLSMKTMLSEISVDYLVNGLFIGSLVYKQQDKQFTDMIPQAADNVQIVSSPFYGVDPLIKLRVPKEIRMFVQSREPYFQRLKSRLSEELLYAMSMSEVSLDNLTTLYIPRKTFTTSQGTSLYRRLIPIYLLEKVLFRGTITEASRRQRSTMLVQMGSEYYEPTDDDLQMLVSMFQQADLDPMGAILATRNDVQVQDIRPAGEFWKWTDVTDTLMPMKLRAVGISEAFLSGDASYSTMESSLSVFIEHIRSYREMITRKIFTNKLFPLVAVIHGFFKDGEHNLQKDGKFTERQLQQYTADPSKLDIPKVEWHKHLKPEADREYLDVLNTLSDHNVPVTLRTWMVAGGMQTDDFEGELEADVKFRKELAKIMKTGGYNIKGEEMPAEGGGEGYEEGGEPSFSSVNDYTRKSTKMLQRIPLLSRQFGEASEVTDTSKTGKKKAVLFQTRANKKINERIAKALTNLSNPEVFGTRMSEARKIIANSGAKPY